LKDEPSTPDLLEDSYTKIDTEPTDLVGDSTINHHSEEV